MLEYKIEGIYMYVKDFLVYFYLCCELYVNNDKKFSVNEFDPHEFNFSEGKNIKCKI